MRLRVYWRPASFFSCYGGGKDWRYIKLWPLLIEWRWGAMSEQEPFDDSECSGVIGSLLVLLVVLGVIIALGQVLPL